MVVGQTSVTFFNDIVWLRQNPVSIFQHPKGVQAYRSAGLYCPVIILFPTF